MKTIMLLMLLPVLVMAQGGGPVGWPAWIEWGEDPTALVEVDGDTLAVTTANAANLVIKMTNDGGTGFLQWNNSGLFYIPVGDLRVVAGVWCDYVRAGNSTTDFTQMYQDGTILSRGHGIKIDPNNAGAGTLTLGEIGDLDIVEVIGLLTATSAELNTVTVDAFKGTIREVTGDYTATLSDWQLIVTDTANVTLPTLASAYDSTGALVGDGLQLDIELFESYPCTLFAASGDSINKELYFVLSAEDNYSIRAWKTNWIIR